MVKESCDMPLQSGPSVHFVLQAKGGVGKSTVSVLLAEYVRSRRIPLRCYDTDPSNATLYEFGSLDAEYVRSLRGFRVGESLFDPMMSAILESHDTAIIVDVGTSNYLPMMSYLRDADFFRLLVAASRPVYVHVPVVAGADHAVTIQGLKSIAEFVGDKGVRIVVWENDLRGVVHSGAVRAGNGSGICGVVPLRIGYDDEGAARGDTFLNDFRLLMEHRLLFSDLPGRAYFDDEKEHPLYEVQRLRLNRIWDDVRGKLDEVAWA
jgi:hypothetical protein